LPGLDSTVAGQNMMTSSVATATMALPVCSRLELLHVIGTCWCARRSIAGAGVSSCASTMCDVAIERGLASTTTAAPGHAARSGRVASRPSSPLEGLLSRVAGFPSAPSLRTRLIFWLTPAPASRTECAAPSPVSGLVPSFLDPGGTAWPLDARRSATRRPFLPRSRRLAFMLVSNRLGAAMSTFATSDTLQLALRGRSSACPRSRRVRWRGPLTSRACGCRASRGSR